MRVNFRLVKIIVWCVSVLVVMAVLSFVQAPSPAMHFIVQFSENLFYACFFGAAALMCFWGLQNRPPDRIAGRLVTVLCVYFCLTFLISSAHQYLQRPSEAETLYTMAAMASAWLPLGCGFALASITGLKRRTSESRWRCHSWTVRRNVTPDESGCGTNACRSRRSKACEESSS